jgi:GTP-binding protein
VHVLDCATLEPGRDPLSDLEIIRNELANYPVADGQVPLLERPQLVVLNKIDVPEAEELADFVRPDLEALGYRVFEISTVARRGLRELTFALGEIIEDHRRSTLAEPPRERVIIRPKGAEKDFTVRVEGGTYGNVYHVLGEKPVRWVQQTDFQNEEAVGFLADRLEKLGVENELFRVGAVPGSTVVIGEGDGIVFDWEPSVSSAAELIQAPRGTDPRLDANRRRTTLQRREEYHARQDARTLERAEEEIRRKARRITGEDEG